jgi:hypothetical protein
MASQTNLSSAASWLFINLLLNKRDRERVLQKNDELREKYAAQWLRSTECLQEMEYAALLLPALIQGC